MTSILCPPIPGIYTAASDREEFFTAEDFRDIAKFEKREQPQIGIPGESCKTNLFFGFFFDGTGNNYELAEKTNEYSNVARLYDIFPGQGVPGVLPHVKWKKRSERYSHFYRVYAPGVGTPFKEVKDSGEGLEAMFGGAGGAKGCDRIVWALIQAINNVNRYFHQQPLLSSEETTALATRIDLTRQARQMMTEPHVSAAAGGNSSLIRPRVEFEKLLRRLHASVSQHWTKNGTPPAKIDPGIVQTIYVSIFGFSRGAAQARAFTNWLDSLCRLDATIRGEGTSSLGGFPVEFDFLGLFDTVASVGLGNTYGNFFLLRAADGHGGWADAEDSLRIPGCVKRCVHLLSGHELRRSFPSDSISVGSVLPDRSQEIVFPGAHSDIGGGYAPTQQGKGLDSGGADMLSRIPLLFMYKQARIAGVPLKLELADEATQERFEVDSTTIDDFNAYISKCTKRSGSLTDIVREQAVLQMAWRYSRREDGPAPLHKIPSFTRATSYDKNDLESANREFSDELAYFKKSVSKLGDTKPKRQDAGFGNSKESEWEEIATYWPFILPDPVVTHFFDEYVHDARSGFKPMGENSEADTIKALKNWSRELKVRKTQYESRASSRDMSMQGPPDYGMSTNQRMAAEKYDETETIPRYMNDGREPYAFAQAGYFRFRKIYAGSDKKLLSNWRPPDSQGKFEVASAAEPQRHETKQPSSKAA